MGCEEKMEGPNSIGIVRLAVSGDGVIEYSQTPEERYSNYRYGDNGMGMNPAVHPGFMLSYYDPTVGGSGGFAYRLIFGGACEYQINEEDSHDLIWYIDNPFEMHRYAGGDGKWMTEIDSLRLENPGIETLSDPLIDGNDFGTCDAAITILPNILIFGTHKANTGLSRPIVFHQVIPLGSSDFFNDACPELEGSFSVLPNGSDMGVTVFTPNQSGQLRIYDCTGRLVREEHISGIQDIRLQRTGLYFFRYADEMGSIELDKLVVCSH